MMRVPDSLAQMPEKASASYLKEVLLKLNKNLNILREREAKYAGNASLELLNQIDDHQAAIVLTEQALAGEISEEEWREALKPLLVVPVVLQSPAGLITGRDINITTVQTATLPAFADEELETTYKNLLVQIRDSFQKIAEALSDNISLQEDAFDHLTNARQILRELGDDPTWTMDRAQYEINRVEFMVAREKMKQLSETRWRWIVPALVVTYIAIIISIILFGQGALTSTTIIPIIDVPLPVVIWAAIGSLSAILYRFYKYPPRRLKTEIQWLVARPIIGIVMGAMAYLAITSGLFIFGVATGENPTGEIARPQIIWFLAFLGGFSDRFFETVIETVIGKVSTPQASESDQAADPGEANPVRGA